MSSEASFGVAATSRAVIVRSTVLLAAIGTGGLWKEFVYKPAFDGRRRPIEDDFGYLCPGKEQFSEENQQTAAT